MTTTPTRKRPFSVRRLGSGWVLIGNYQGGGILAVAKTQAEAIDHAYRRWPWWP